MKRKMTRWAALALAVLLTLGCVGCGQVPAADADGTGGTTQQTVTKHRKNGTKTDTKADAAASDKADAAADAKTDDKTDTKTDDKASGADKQQTEQTDEDKQSEQKKDEQKKDETNKAEQPKQEETKPSAPDPTPTPTPMPTPTPTPTPEPEPAAATVSLYISCATVLDNMDKCSDSVKGLIPADGVILSATVTITEGESVMSVLKRACGDAGIPVSSSGSYVKGINGLFEKNVGRSSGWMYCVGGTFPNYGADSYTLSGGESIQWLYTCNLGADVGNTYMG